MFERKKDAESVIDDFRYLFLPRNEEHKTKLMNIFLKYFGRGYLQSKEGFKHQRVSERDLYPLESALGHLWEFKKEHPDYERRVEYLGTGAGEFMSFFEHGVANEGVHIFNDIKVLDKALDIITKINKILKDRGMHGSVEHIRKRLEKIRDKMSKNEKIMDRSRTNLRYPRMEFMDKVIKIFS